VIAIADRPERKENRKETSMSLDDDATTNTPVCPVCQAAEQKEREEAGRRAALHQERLAAGRLIEPATAEITWWWGQTMDPYGDGCLPAELEQTGRVYFARSPGGDWVCFYDLPEETVTALRAKPFVDALDDVIF
jgi:hypothetical protein